MTQTTVSYSQKSWDLSELISGGMESPALEAAFTDLDKMVTAFEALRPQLSADISVEAFLGIVRKLEEMAQKPAMQAAALATPKRSLTAELSSLEDAMREALGVKTTLSGNERKGKITLSYNSAQELEHLYEVFGRLHS